jgi:hypothetical protein
LLSKLQDVTEILGLSWENTAEPYSAEELLSMLAYAASQSVLFPCREAARSLPRELAFQAIQDAMARVPDEKLSVALSVLWDFRDPRSLDWIESSIHGPKASWGVLAVCCGIDWPRLRRWLDMPGPLRMAALEALCLYLGDDDIRPGNIQDDFVLDGGPGVLEIKAFLDRALANDPSPEVKQKRARIRMLMS